MKKMLPPYRPLRSRPLLVFSFLLFVFPGFTQDTLFLTSPQAQWQVHRIGSQGYYKANVPGNIYTDLFRAGAIPDPFYGANEQQVNWIDTCTWEYTSMFTLTEEQSRTRSYSLVSEGLDTYANIYLNGELIGASENMFIPGEWRVKKHLRPGKNFLRIVFLPARKRALELLKNHTPRLPGGERVFSRKAQYQFGWDWAPSLAGCGIWKPIYLVAGDRKNPVQHWSLMLDKFTRKTTTARLSIFSADSVTATVLLEMDNNPMLEKRVVLHGAQSWEIPLRDPKLWWPAGYGEPYRYKVKLTVIMGNRTLVFKRRIGLRKTELVQEKDKTGSRFYFRINGTPIFMKGANYVPAEQFYPVAKEKYRALIEAARSAHFNMLRVWGGGVYEDDYFYELCDENGIMVWQDMLYACGMYPAGNTNLVNTGAEISRMRKRLENHPCIVMWCGNNENREGWFNWGWQKELHYSPADSLNVWNDYISLFEREIPKQLDTASNHIPYWPSSPLHGWGREISLREGDLHYWGVWWGKEPFEKYNEKIPRFMSEYGFQGMPPLPTIRQFADSSQWDTASVQMKNHQKHPFGFENISTYMQRYFGEAKTFEDYVYLSQLTQAYGMRTAIEAHRRNKPYCMGTLYWQFNDCWPGISWSTIDYYGRWKAAHYEVKRLYQTVLLCFDPDTTVRKLHLISDSLDAVSGRLTITGYDATGNAVRTWQKEMQIPALGHLTLTVPPFISNAHPLIWKADFVSSHGGLTETTWWEIWPKDIPLKKPTINIGWADSTLLSFSADVPVKSLYVEIDGYTGNLGDNFFDLLPGEQHLVRIPKGYLRYRQNCAPQIRLTSLYDVMRRNE